MLNLKAIREKYNHLPDGDVQIILAGIIRRDRAYILAHPEYRPTACQRVQIALALSKLARHYSVALILGHKEFYGLNFFVNKHTLIPRPDTELMAESAINILNQQTGGGLLIDVGTGSGCIPIAVLKTLKQKNIIAVATDISGSALRTAKKNSLHHSVNIVFNKSDLLKNLNDSLLNNTGAVVITANLPYLTRAWTKAEPSIAREPDTALIADDANGLCLYKKLFHQINNRPIFFKRHLSILIEIDPRQTSEALALAKESFPHLSSIDIKKDLSGRDRLIVINIEPSLTK